MAKKLKGLDLAQYGDLAKALALIADTAQAARAMAQTVLDDANSQVESHKSLMQAHLDRHDLRPRVNFKPLPKNNWAVSFNSEVYTLGPVTNLSDINEDDPAFCWKGPDGVLHPARTMFQALVGVVMDYCNEAVDTGPVTEETSNEP